MFKNFNGYWKKDQLDVPSLKNINVHIPRGAFYGVTGRIGSGKSGFLNVILEEMPYYSGKFDKTGTVNYVEQETVILSTTIK